MNISPKFLDIKTSTPTDRAEEKPEADLVSVEDFLLESDNPAKPKTYIPSGAGNEDAHQDFLQALSITPVEPPIPPQGNSPSSDFFAASLSGHLIVGAAHLQTAASADPIDIPETSLPTHVIRSGVALPSVDIFPASSPIASTNVALDLRPSTTDMAPIDNRTLAHAATDIDGMSVPKAKDGLSIITPSQEVNSAHAIVDAAKDETHSVTNITDERSAPKLEQPQHKVITEIAIQKDAEKAAPLTGAKSDDAATTKTETIMPALNKFFQTSQASNGIIAKALALETPKTLPGSPELTAQEAVQPEKAAIKDTPLLPSISKNVELAHSFVADAPKLTGETATPFAPITNPLSDSTVKAPQAVSIIAGSTSTSPPALQIVAQTLVKAQETQSGISIRLDPPEMGRVFIDFKFEADRSVTAIIRSEVVETAMLLKEKADFFHQTLKDSGFDSINLNFQQNDPSEQKAFEHEYIEKAPAFFHVEQSDEDPIENAASPSHRYKLSPDAAIDIKL